jgi:multisubunit Na+/H+ antiporter MnhC subunit
MGLMILLHRLTLKSLLDLMLMKKQVKLILTFTLIHLAVLCFLISDGSNLAHVSLVLAIYALPVQEWMHDVSTSNHSSYCHRICSELYP